MPMSSPHHSAPRTRPLGVVTGTLAIVVLAWMLHPRSSGSDAPAPVGATPTICPSGETCDTAVGTPSVVTPASGGPIVHARDVCPGTGYLCAGLARDGHVLIHHWTDFSGTIVVHVPLPTGESTTDARSLRRAAEAGLRAWNGQPFPVLVDEGGTRPANFSVTWVRSLGGKRIGLAHTQWSNVRGLRAISIQLVTRDPLDPTRVLDPRQVQLAAAHEMGHALGLSHSDSERDVMYPSNTATALSAQDYRTMEALYALKDGTEIVR